jgi:2-amino-4-hydroxy-6-hydroxymethyldihydropteridine diphosphokinase
MAPRGGPRSGSQKSAKTGCMPLKKIYLSLGSNLGNREENLHRALQALDRERIPVVARSAIYETEPRDMPDQPWFLNMAVACETRCFPLQLLAVLHKIERESGRVRGAGDVRQGPRILDLDILLFGNAVVDTPELTIPHPRMLERRFVLEPLVEIAPDLRHPVTKELLSKYLFKVAGQRVTRLPTT